MKTQIRRDDRRRGTVLMVVMGMIVIGSLAVGSILSSALGKMRLADKQLCLEQAFYIAQAGAERAATLVADGQTQSATRTANFGAGNYVTQVTYYPGMGGEFTVDIESTGTVKGQSRTIKMRGVQRASWARYALWYDAEATKLWITPGEKFGGPVYSRPQFHFHDKDLATKGQVVFSGRASSGAATIEKASDKVNPNFQRGLALNARLETMVSVEFPALFELADSGGGLVLYGPTTIELDGPQMKITNTDKGWSNKLMPVPANGLLYVGSTKTEQVWVPPANKKAGYYKTVTSTFTADASVSAPKGFQGRLTIVADKDVNITNHIKYKTDPSVNPNSTDALGLIAKQHIVVQKSAPNNVYIFAHMIAANGGFGVKDHSTGSGRGMLNVYGGIVNQMRNAVGIVGGAGYNKNYVFDTRFSKNPPPNYPKQPDELEWSEWEG